MSFTRATMPRVPAKLAICGASGTGKTYSALLLARGLVSDSGKIAVIDTENGSSCLYSDLTPFDVSVIKAAPMSNGVDIYNVKDIVKAIKDAETAKYNALVIDSASVVWSSLCLFKERLDEDGGSQYCNWSKPKARLAEFKNTVVNSSMHIICCFRQKTEYVIETIDGKNKPRRVGTTLEASKGAEYDYSIVFELDREHNARLFKSRLNLGDDNAFCEPLTRATGEKLSAFFNKR